MHQVKRVCAALLLTGAAISGVSGCTLVEPDPWSEAGQAGEGYRWTGDGPPGNFASDASGCRDRFSTAIDPVGSSAPGASRDASARYAADRQRAYRSCLESRGWTLGR